MKNIVIGVLMLLIGSALIAGCDMSIQSVDYQNADKLCASNGGVDYIFVSGSLNIYCTNGAVFTHVGKASR